MNRHGQALVEFVIILLLFCISLCLDVFQYLVRGIMWHIYYYLKREPQADENQTQAEEPEWLNSFPDSFWYAKYVPTIIAYIGLAEHLGITALGDCAFINMLGTWKVVYVVGIIFGVLMLWYVITESLKKNNGEKSNSILCRCIRVTIGILSLICFTLKLFL